MSVTGMQTPTLRMVASVCHFPVVVFVHDQFGQQRQNSPHVMITARPGLQWPSTL
jgi:hypothetical protein